MRWRVSMLIVFLLMIQTSYAMKALFIYTSAINDGSFTFVFEKSRVAAEKKLTLELGYNITTAFEPNVLPSMLPDIFDRYVPQGYTFFALCGFFDGLATFYANKYPDFYFLSGGMLPTANLASLLLRAEEWYFLNGIMCGMTTKSNKVATVSPLTELNTGYVYSNAFWKGVKMVNPNASVELVRVENENDPIVIRYAITEISKTDIDCIAIQQTRIDGNKVASEFGIISGGFATDVRYDAGEYVFTSAVVIYDGMFEELLIDAYLNTWAPFNIIETSFNGSFLELGWWSSIATQPEYTTMRHTVETWVEKLTNTSEQQIFCGELATKMGWPKQNESDCLTLNQYLASKTLIADIPIIAHWTSANVIQLIFITWNDPVSIVVSILSTVFILICIATFIHILCHFQHPVYRQSSALFMLIILGGLTMMAMSLFMWSLKPSQSSCMGRVWLGGMGWAFILSSMLAKIQRIYTIFNLRDFSITPVTDWQQLMKFVVVIVFIEIIMIAPWNRYAALEEATTNQVRPLAYNELYMYCKSTSNAPLIVFLVLNLILLLPAIVICWLTRNVPQQYNESSTIFGIVTISAIVSLVTIGLTIMVSDYIVSLYTIPTIGLLILIIFIYVLMFLPKLLRIHNIWDSTTQSPSASRSTGNYSAPSRYRSNTSNVEVVASQKNRSYDDQASSPPRFSTLNHQYEKKSHGKQEMVEMNNTPKRNRPSSRTTTSNDPKTLNDHKTRTESPTSSPSPKQRTKRKHKMTQDV